MMLNTQPAEPVVANSGDPKYVDVCDIWHTIQGEGRFAGTPAIFIRLAGCNLRCPLCDTDYTSKRETLTPGAIIDRIHAMKVEAHLVVLTGGEPFRQNIVGLLEGLFFAGMFVQIETNGSINPALGEWGQAYKKQGMLWLSCSPKVRHLEPGYEDADFKYVLKAGEVDEHDGLPTTTLGKNFRPARPAGFVFAMSSLRRLVFVQPLDEQDERKNAANLEAAKQSALKFGYRLGVQLHKIVGLP